MKKIKFIAKEIFLGEKIEGWKISWWKSPPSECHHSLKEIWISESYQNQPLEYQFEILLHEISHIFCNDHSPEFYKIYGSLMVKYSNLLSSIES
jgi:predicted metal-dependent hydrolase